jgi:hypothetical protein
MTQNMNQENITAPVLLFQPFSRIIKNTKAYGLAGFKLPLQSGINSLLKLQGQLAAATCRSK